MQQRQSYADIKSGYKSSWYIPYTVLLELKEWREFRKRILERDMYTCDMCKRQSDPTGKNYYRSLTEEEIRQNQQEVTFDLLGDGTFIIKMPPLQVIGEPIDTPVILHAHHKYYIFGYTPWEYSESAMTTLCHDCHHELHNTLVIPVYIDETKKERIPLTPCKRCSGTGYLREYYYYMNGICFKCNGRKFEEFIPLTT